MDTQPESAAFSRFNANGRGRLMLVCEHASNFIPERFGRLQLDDAALSSHIALDIGALPLAQEISRLLDAPLLSTRVSRLIYDCNRAFEADDAIPERSEVFRIPGNENLSGSERRRRYEEFYLPFEKALSEDLAGFAEPPILITIHSFTPVYHGKPRKLDIGIISDGESRLMDKMVELAAQHRQYCTEANQPYAPGNGVTHTLSLHGDRNNLLNAMIEVKNDLLGNPEMRLQMAQLLAGLISTAAQQLGIEISPEQGHAGCT